jgi:spermidine dehydrogenase
LSRGQYGFWFGAKFGCANGLWLIDPVGKQMQGAPVAETTRTELQRWFSGKAAEEAKFDLPKYEGDAASRRLDSMSLEQHYVEHFGRFVAPV